MTYEEMMGQASPTPAAAPGVSPPPAGGGMTFEQMSGQQQAAPSPPPQSTPSGTPATDQAVAAASNVFGWGAPRSQEQYQALHGRGLTAAESNARWQNFMQESGKSISPLPLYTEDTWKRSPLPESMSRSQVAKSIGGLYNAGAQLYNFGTSPRGLAELGITAATGGVAGIPLIAAEMWPYLPEQAKHIYKAATNQLSPTESAEAAGGLLALLAPGAHVLRGRFGPAEFKPVLPAPPGTVYEPLPFSTREVPGPPIPAAGTEGFVGPVIEQATKEVTTDASGKPSTEEVGVRGERGGVGEKAPLRQPGETTTVRPPGEESKPATEAVAGEPQEATAQQIEGFKRRRDEAQEELKILTGTEGMPPEKIQARKDEIDHLDKQISGELPPDALPPMPKSSEGIAKERIETMFAGDEKAQAEHEAAMKEAEGELRPEDMTAAQLSAHIAQQRADPAAPPVPVSLTQLLKDKQAAETKQATQAEPVTAEDPRITELKAQTADLRNQAADILRRRRVIPQGESREARIARRDIAKERDVVLTKLWSTWDEIHKIRAQAAESGKPREFVIIGGGAGGLKAAGHAAYEGIDTVLLEKEASTGGQAKRSMEIVNTGATGEGATGRDYFRPRYLTARNRGAEIRTGVEVVNLRPRADGAVDVITKSHGVIPAWRVAILTGSRAIKFPGYEHSGWGNAERLERLAAGKIGMTTGSGNSASQAILGAIREGAKKIIAVSRSKFGPEISSDQMERLQDLEKKGQLQFVLGTVKRVTPDPSTGGVIVQVKTADGDVEFPVAHLENFLATALNTGWLPEGIAKKPTFDKKGNPVPGPVRVRDSSLKTTMEGVLAGGDIRESLPGEEKGRRIDIAEGDAAGIATRVTKEILYLRKHGKLPEWKATPEEIRSIDEELKLLKGLEEETLKTTTPLPRSTGGPTIPLPTKNEPISRPTSKTSDEKTTPKLVFPEPVPAKKPPKQYGPIKRLPPPPSPGTPLGQQQQQQEEGRPGFFVVPGAIRPPEVEIAKSIAEQQHKGQKYADRPYISHVEEVVNAVRPELKPAAYLHDVVEDTKISPRKLAEQGISNKTIETVQALTRRPSETYAGYIDRLANNVDAREIKLADLRTNLRTLPEDSTLRPRYVKALDKLQTAETAAADPVRVQAEADARVAANPLYSDQLITDLASGRKTAMDAADEQVMVKTRARFNIARDMAGRKALDKNATPEERAAAAHNFENLDNHIRQMNVATDDGMRLSGPKEQRAWHQFRQKDYEFPAMEQRMTIAKGGIPLTPQETAKLTRDTNALSNAMVDVQNAKARTGWRPGLGSKADPGLRHLQYKAHQAKEKLDDQVFAAKLKHDPFLRKAGRVTRELSSIPRAIMASVDLSAVRRQGGLFFMSHPFRSIAAMPDMIRAARSDEAYFKLMQDIRERPNADLYVSSKLGLTDIKSPKLSQLEEQYMSKWADKIPLVSHSQRAYVYFLNRLRADTFDAMASTLGRKGVITQRQADGLSNFINVFTGRGRIPPDYAQSLALLNELFFAPRYTLSRFQALTMQPLRFAKDPRVRLMIAGEYARTLIGFGIVYGLADMVGKQMGVTVEADPRSTDFGKIKIGDTRIDILSGLSQPAVLMARFLTGKTKTAGGKIESISGPRQPFSQRNINSILYDFGRSKLAPIPSAVLNAKSGKKVTGEPTTLTQEVIDMFTPMSPNDIYKAMRQYGVAKGAAVGLLAMFGDSVQTYSARARATRKQKLHRAR